MSLGSFGFQCFFGRKCCQIGEISNKTLKKTSNQFFHVLYRQHISCTINLRLLDEQSICVPDVERETKPIQNDFQFFSRWLGGRLQPLFVQSMSPWKLRKCHRCGLILGKFLDSSIVPVVQAAQHAVYANLEHTRTLQV